MSTGVLPEFAAIVEEIAELPPGSATPEKRFIEDLQVDSLAMVEIAEAAKERFGVRFANDTLRELHTVQDAVDRITAGAPVQT